ncbi:hypothetical protein GY45DRAFT_369194 [Cubamyces sp. BRFM 1775]|nr:hypothetical protein GY45DRAFT_369194 [Cubamyces sp. BRFM 1775]
MQKYHPMLVPTYTAASTSRSSHSGVATRSTLVSLRAEGKGEATEAPRKSTVQPMWSNDGVQKPSQNQASPSALSQSSDESLEGNVSSQSLPRAWGDGQKTTPQSLHTFTLRPATWSPVGHTRAKAKDTRTYSGDPILDLHVSALPTASPTNAQLARMREQDAHTSATSSSKNTSMVQPQIPGPLSTQMHTTNVASPLARDAYSSCSDKLPRRVATPQSHRPTIEELQRTLDEIAPIADSDERAREQVRELRQLLSNLNKRTAYLKTRARRLQQLRLALELYIFSPGARQDPSTAANTEGERGHGDCTDEEAELEEVKELTSSELACANLPSSSDDGATIRYNDSPTRKRKTQCHADDGSPEQSPSKRARTARWMSSV